MQAILSFINSNPALVVGLFTTIGGWIWHRKVTANDLWDTLMQMGRQVFPEIVKDARLYDDAYVLARIEGAIWAGLSRLGVKRSSGLESLVHEAAEHVKAELAAKLTEYHLDKTINVLQQTSLELKKVPDAPQSP